ncbi:hypothetical protein ACXGQP_05530 [Enterobacter oligotrophicus]
MYYSQSILDSLEAERYLSLQLEKALSGVKENVVAQAKQIGQGVRRLTWYVSCFMDNYQDVCATLKEDEVRFVLGIAEIIKERNVIYTLLKIYVETLLRNRSQSSIENIHRILLSMGVHISIIRLTNKAFVSAITLVVMRNVNIASFVGVTRNLSNLVLFGLSYEGLVHKAAECAANLKYFNPYYYQALYQYNLEMMYFLIEPAITKAGKYNPVFLDDSQIGEILRRLIKGY